MIRFDPCARPGQEHESHPSPDRRPVSARKKRPWLPDRSMSLYVSSMQSLPLSGFYHAIPVIIMRIFFLLILAWIRRGYNSPDDSESMVEGGKPIVSCRAYRTCYLRKTAKPLVPCGKREYQNKDKLSHYTEYRPLHRQSKTPYRFPRYDVALFVE